MRWKAPFTLSILLAVIIALFGSSVLAEEDSNGTDIKIFNDDQDDGITTTVKRDLTRLVDLKDLKGEKIENLQQESQVDIDSLTIEQDDTFTWFTIQTYGDISDHEQFSYHIAGYISEDQKETDPYDFRIIYENRTAVYYELVEGTFVVSKPVSNVEIDGKKLTIQMNKGNFILSGREDPYLIAAIVVLDEGIGEDLHIDHVLTSSDDNGKGDPIDETTLIMIQFGILGFAFIAVIVIWKLYLQKKGDEDQGGICPRCEARLDSSLDFCPSCGTFIRGPKAKSIQKKPDLAPILDEE